MLAKARLGGAAVIAIAALAALDASLLLKNRSLNREVASGEYSQQPPIGGLMPALRGIDFSGRSQTVSYSAGQAATFLFVFSAGCQICSLSWPSWLRMVNAADPERYRVVFVSLDGQPTPPAIAGQLKTDHTVFTHPDPSDVAGFNLRLTPEILEVAPSGRLTRAWLGQLDAASTATLCQALGIAPRVPGRATSRVPEPDLPRVPSTVNLHQPM